MAQAGIGEGDQVTTMKDRSDVFRGLIDSGMSPAMASYQLTQAGFPPTRTTPAGIGDDVVEDDFSYFGGGDDEASFLEALGTNLQGGFRSGVEGLSGMVKDYGDGGWSESLDDFAEDLQPSEERLERLAARQEEMGFIGGVGDAIAGEAPVLAGTVGAGALAGAALGSVLPGFGSIVGGVIGAGYGALRMYDQGRDNVIRGKLAAERGVEPKDITEDEVRAYSGELSTEEKGKVALGASTGMLDAFPAGKILKAVAGQKVAGIAAKHIGKELLKGGAKTGLKEGSMEVFQELSIMVLTDKQVQADIAKMDDASKYEIGKMLAETRGPEIATAFLAGFGLGGGAGAIAGSIETVSQNKQVETLTALAEKRGVDLSEVEAAIKADPAKAQALQQGGYEMQELAMRLKTVDAQREKAQSEEEREELDAMREAYEAQLSIVTDRTLGDIGVAHKTSQDLVSETAQKETERKDRVASIQKTTGLPQINNAPLGDIEVKLERVLDAQADRTKALQKLQEASSEERRSAAREDYDAALDTEASERVAYAKLADPDADVGKVRADFLAEREAEIENQNIVSKRRAEEVAAASDQDARYERLIDANPTKRKLKSAANAIKRNIRNNGEEKAIKELLTKKRSDRDAALTDPSTTERDLVKLEDEIADLESKEGTPNPTGVLADRILSDLEGGFDPAVDRTLPRGGEAAGTPSSDTTAPGDAATVVEPEATESMTGAAIPESDPVASPVTFADPDITDVRQEVISDYETARGDKSEAGRARRDDAVERILGDAGIDVTPETKKAFTRGTGKVQSRLNRAAKADPNWGQVSEPQSIAAAVDVAPETESGLGGTRAEIRKGKDANKQYRWNDLTDDVDLSAGMEAHEAKMREWMEDKHEEFSAAYDADGNILGIGGNGMGKGVAWPTHRWDEAAIFTHSHPMPTPFSSADVHILRRMPNLQAVRAVVKGRNTIEIRATPALRKMSWADLEAFYDNVITPAREASIAAKVFPKGADIDTQSRIAQEAAMTMLVDAGLIEYTTTLDAIPTSERDQIYDISDRRTDFDGRGGDVGTTPEGSGVGQVRSGAREDSEAGAGVQEAAPSEAAGGPAEELASALDILEKASVPPIRPGAADPAKLRALTKPVFDKAKAFQIGAGKTAIEKLVKSGELKQANVDKGVMAALHAITYEGAEATTVAMQVAMVMFPNAQLKPSKVLKSAAKGALPKLNPDWQLRINAAFQLLRRVGRDEGMGFRFDVMPFQQTNGWWDYEATHFLENSKLEKAVGMVAPEQAKFSEPMSDPDDTSKITRHASNIFSDEAIDRMRATARIMQNNTYYLDQDYIAALTVDEMISNKKLGANLMKRDPDTGEILFSDGSSVDSVDLDQLKVDKDAGDLRAKELWPQARFIKTQRFRQKKKLGMLQRMARDHGDKPVGFQYQVDDKGRIYASGPFNPQTGDISKGMLRVGAKDGPSLKELPTVDHSASGWQMSALMTRDSVAAGWYNLGPHDGDPTSPAMTEGYSKRDVYKKLMEDLKASIEADAAAGDPSAKVVKDIVFDGNVAWGKTQVKPAVIAVNYAGAQGNFEGRFEEVYGQLWPKGQERKINKYLAKKGFDDLRAKAPRAMAFQDWAIKALTQVIEGAEGGKNALLASPELEFSVGLDGKYQKLKPKSAEIKMHAVDKSTDIDIGSRELEQSIKVPTSKVDAKASARSVFSQIIQGFDASVLHRAFDIFRGANPDVFITSNHDSYTVPDGYAGAMAAASRQAMKEIFTDMDAPGRLLAEIKAQAEERGISIKDLQPDDLFNADGSFIMGDYDLNTLDTSVPVFVENEVEVDGVLKDDFVPALTDLQGNLIEEGPDVDADGNYAGPAIARGIDYDAADAGETTGVKMDTSLPKAAQFAQDSQFQKGRDFKAALQDQALAAQEGSVDLRNNTPEVADRLVDFVMEDAQAALVNNANAVGWYDRTVTEAMDTLAELHPEIKTDPEARFKYIWALAVTSNGLKVDKNFELAEQAYNTLKTTGAFPTDVGIGQAASGINDGLAYYQPLVDRMGGWEAARDFMVKRMPVRDIERISGVKVSKEGKGAVLPGAVILGPKIGGGFFSNLYGNFDELTMDRWFTRTLGRWRGNLLETNPKMEAKKRHEVKTLLKGLSPADIRGLKAHYGGAVPIRKTMTNAEINNLAIETAKQSMDPAWRKQVNALPGGEAMRKIGNGLAKYLDGQKEDPGGAKDREFIRGVFRRGIDNLRAKPNMSELTMADLQALLWYPEKRLYDTAKQPEGQESLGYGADEAPDYANAARKLVDNRLGQAGRDGAGRGSSVSGAEPSFGPPLTSLPDGPVGPSGGPGTSTEADSTTGEYEDGIATQDEALAALPGGEQASGGVDEGSGGNQQAAGSEDRPGDTGLAQGVDEWTGRQPSVTDAQINKEIEYSTSIGRETANAVLAHIRHSPLFGYDRIMNAATRADGKDYGPAFYKAHADFTKGMGATLAGLSRSVPPSQVALYLDMVDAQKNDHISKLVQGINMGTIEVSDVDPRTKLYRGGSGKVADTNAVKGAVRDTEIPSSRGRMADGLAYGTDLDVPGYMKATPDASAAMATTVDRIKNPLLTSRTIGQWIEDNIVNRFAPIRRLEQALAPDGLLAKGAASAFKFAEMAVNDAGRMFTLHHEGAAALSSDGAYTSAAGTKGLREIFDMVGKGQDMVDWMSYMIARRAQDLKSRGIKTPLSDTDISDALAKASGKPEYSDAAAEWKKHNDANVDFLRKTGRITKKQADAMKADDFYVPFWRDMDDGKVIKGAVELDLTNLTRGGGRGGSTEILGGRNPGIHKMKGSDQFKIDNLLRNMIRNSEAMASAGMRNQAANKIFDLMEGSGGMVRTHRASAVDRAPKGAVKMYKDGIEYWVEPMTDAAVPVMTAMAGLEPLKLGKFVSMGSSMASIFRQGITLSPAFMIRNAIRGAVSAGVHTGWSNVSQHANTLSGFRDAYRKDAATKAFMRESGMGDYSFGNVETGMGKDDILIDYGLAPKTAFSRIREVVNKMEEIGTASELADRMAAYKTMVANGVPSSEASWQAQNIINYGRKGSLPELRAVLSMVPFLNARIQGLARIAEGATDKKATPMDRRKAAQQMVVAAIPLMVVSAALWGLNNADEEKREKYKAEPMWRRQNYHILYVGDKTLLIPKAFEIGHMFSTIPEMMADALVNDMGGELVPGVSNIISQTLMFNAIPAPLVPILEAKTNYSFFKGQPLIPQREKDLRARDQTANSGSLAQLIGRTMGISDLTKVSPTIIEHYLRGYGGAYYNVMATAADTLSPELGLGPAKRGGAFGDVPVASTVLNNVLGSMVKETDMNSDKYLNEFYENKGHITSIYRSAAAAHSSGDVEYAEKLMAQAPATERAYKIMNKAGYRMGKLNSAIRAIDNDRKMTQAEKRIAIQPLLQKRRELSRKVSFVIDELEEKQGTTFKAAS